MKKVSTYLSSMRYLKPVQIYGRLSMLARRKVLHRSKAYRSRYSPQAMAQTEVIPLPFAADTYRPGDLNGIAEGTFTFLNRSVDLGQPINWFPDTVSQLWLYNLHYFDYVVPLAQQFIERDDRQIYCLFRRLIRDWLQSNPVARSVAWDPYPVSLRISNWLKAYSAFEPALREDSSFADELRRSLFSHALFLENNVEYHLLGNHLIENGRALLFTGLFFTDKKADDWRLKGEQILWQELQEQFLDDGGHYELSPMYHQIMLHLYQDVMTVLQAAGQTVPEEVTKRVQAMRVWLGQVLHPDGDLALFNDAAFGIAGPPTDLLKEMTPANGTALVNEARPEALQILSDSGYFTFRDHSTRNFMIFDCGRLGPDYQPGHGHCDALSYELSLAGQRMIVDSGVGDYYDDLKWRAYYRGTRAHNTVVVDEAEQSEIWGRFRVARRTRPLAVQWADDGAELAYVGGSHSGYQRLPGKVVHQRWVCWIDRSFWLISDHITGQGEHQAESLIHFHPDVEIVTPPLASASEQGGQVQNGEVTLKIIPWGVQRVSSYYGESAPIQGWYAPEFGLQLKNTVWGLHQAGRLPIQFGYILWPYSTDVKVQHSMLEVDASCVEVQSAKGQYRVVFSPKAVVVEKK